MHRVGQGVADLDVTRAAQQRELNIAHHPRCEVEVLRRHKDVILPAQRAFCDQCSPRSTRAVIQRDEAVAVDLLYNVTGGNLRHAAADVIGREELADPVVAEFQLHVRAAQKILLPVGVKGVDHILYQFREHRALCFLVLLDDPLIHCLALRGDEVAPYLPQRKTTGQAAKPLHKVRTLLICDSHNVPSRV